MKDLIPFLKSLNFKNIVGDSAFTFIGFFVSTWFKDREISINEMNEYERYVTEALVLNDHPVKKRMLAQYFANITPSGFQSSKWQCYLKAVEKDYIEFKIQDSIDRQRYVALLNLVELNNGEAWEKSVLDEKLKALIKKENADLIIPNIEKKNSFAIYIQYKKNAIEKAEGVKKTLEELGYNVKPLDEENGLSESDIRYFSDEDEIFAKVISETIFEKHNLKLKQKNFKILSKNVQNKTFEIWITD